MILLVDDNDSVRLVTAMMLQDLGYPVRACSSGSEAISRFRETPARYDCVLLDIVMPGMNGIECCKELKKFRRDVKVIYCTGYSAEKLRQDPECKDNFRVLRKPYRSAELDQAIKETLADLPK